MKGRRRAARISQSAPEATRLRHAREEIYEQIGQLEADYRAKIVREDEYLSHLEELRIRAAELLRLQETLGDTPDAMEQLEIEIEAARKSASAASGRRGN